MKEKLNYMHANPSENEKKTRERKPKTEGGAPFAWLRVALTKQFMLADGFIHRRKKPKVLRATRPTCNSGCTALRRPNSLPEYRAEGQETAAEH